MGTFGLSSAEAAAFGAYVAAWRLFADGAISAADVPAAFLLGRSPPASGPLRWSNASETRGAPRMWSAPFNATRFEACLALGVGPQAPAFDVRFVDCSSGAQRGAGSRSAAAPARPPLLRALLAVPFAVVDRGAFSSQPLPPAPGPAHAAHWVSARVNPAWRKANAGFAIQGRHHVTGRALMLAFADAPRGTASPAATATRGASPSPSAAGAPAAAAAALLSTPAAAAVSAAALLLAAAAAGAAWRRLRRRGGAPGGSPQAVLRPNPASASSAATLRGDVLSVWQTAAEGGAGSAAAAARAAALREVLLLRGDAPLPPTPGDT